MKLTLRQDSEASGALLMQQDWELLQASSEGKLAPLVRFYAWDVPTLSLGFHQNISQIDETALLKANVPWVRRPTGGAAVLHSDELTYAIILPFGAESKLSFQIQELVGRAITRGLRLVGVAAELDPRGEPMNALPNRTSCFVRTSRWEITAHGRKIVGSAQRKLENAILQHGSILMGDDHLRIANFLRMDSESSRIKLRENIAKHSTSIEQELTRRVSKDELRRAMADAFESVFDAFHPALTGYETETVS